MMQRTISRGLLYLEEGEFCAFGCNAMNTGEWNAAFQRYGRKRKKDFELFRYRHESGSEGVDALRFNPSLAIHFRQLDDEYCRVLGVTLEGGDQAVDAMINFSLRELSIVRLRVSNTPEDREMEKELEERATAYHQHWNEAKEQAKQKGCDPHTLYWSRFYHSFLRCKGLPDEEAARLAVEKFGLSKF